MLDALVYFIFGFHQNYTFYEYIPEKDCVEQKIMHFSMWGHGFTGITKKMIYDKNDTNYVKYKNKHFEDIEYRNKLRSITLPNGIGGLPNGMGGVAFSN